MKKLNRFEHFLCRPAVPICLAYIAGILSEGRKTLSFSATAVAMLLLAGVLLLKSTQQLRRRRIFLSIWLMLPLFSILGYMRKAEADTQTPLKAVLVKSTEAQINGTIDYISIRDDGYSVTLTGSAAQIGQLSFKSDKLITLLDYDMGISPKPGDILRADGVLYPFDPATNPGQFDSEMYYAARQTDARLFAQKVEISDGRAGRTYIKAAEYRLKEILYRIRIRLSNGIYKVLPEKEAGILNSILTGDRGMLDEDVKDMYSEGGIAHILSISSLHVTLLGMGLYRLLMKAFGRLGPSVMLTIVSMIMYGMLTGFSVSTARAVLMLSTALLGKLLGRGYDLLSGTALSAMILLMIQPLYIYDAGFRLSYMAVLGIFAATETVRYCGIKNNIAVSLLMSGYVQLFTLPVILNTYYFINPYSVIVNLAVLPLMSILLVTGFGCGITGSLAATAAAPVAGPVYGILKIFEMLCETEKKLPYGTVLTGAPTNIQTMIYYSAIALSYFLIGEISKREDRKQSRNKVLKGTSINKREKRKRNIKKLAGFLPLVICTVIFVKPHLPEVYASFLDVGQGDSIYLEIDGKRILMDSGSTSVKQVGKYRVIPFLKYNGVTELDNVIISHFDADHVNAVEEMLSEGYPCIKKITAGTNTDPDTEVLRKAVEMGIPISFISAENMIEPNIRCIAPEKGKTYEDSNSGSVVVEISCGEFCMLLTGDSDFESEDYYTKRLTAGKYSVLKCAHHGSRYSTSEAALKRIKPLTTIISCAKYNSYNHPNPYLIARLVAAGSDIYTTPDCGCITIKFRKEKGMEVKTYK